jgi:tellurite resistance protein
MAQLIIGLIIIGLILKYLYVLVPLVCLALVVFGIAKLIKSESKTTSNSLTALSLTLPDMHPSHDIENHYETPITLPHNNTASEAVTKVDAECAFCHTLGQHKLLRVTDTTVDLNCRACGKNFFILKSKLGRDTPTAKTDYTIPYPSDITVFGASAKQEKTVPPDTLWVPGGTTVKIAGYSISGGMFYSGTGLRSVNQYDDEPALIRPKLKVDTTNPDRDGHNMGYWPSYSKIPPGSRAAFLEWLSTGKKAPDAFIGYVFIYFYGLERRALADAIESAAAREEIPAIVTEVKRLLSIYGNNGSFRGYASRFLYAIQASQVTAPFYLQSPSLETISSEFPLTLKIAIGQMANDGVPLSAEWALAWAEHDPTMPRRMPSQRCPAEFGELFKIRYNEKFGDGLKFKPNKTRLVATYHPASASFGRGVRIPIGDLPDVTATTGTANKIRDLAVACTDELEGYSRYLGRNPNGKNSMEAAAYLPQALLKRHDGKEFQQLRSWLDIEVPSDGPISMSCATLLQHLPAQHKNTMTKKEASSLVNLLGKMNVGMEPDPRFGIFSPKPDQNVVLFRISDNPPSSPSTEYTVATVVLHLASAVAGADGTSDAEEKRYLQEHLETWLHLSPEERMRLRAHSQWLLSDPRWLLSSFPGMYSVKKRVELLKQEDRESLGRFLVGVAQADGIIDAAEMKILTRIYEMLGLDTQSLYSQAHAAAVEPVTVQPADFIRPQGHAIPPPPPEPATGVSLDMDSIKAKLAETVAVSAILNNIFKEEEPAPPAVPEPVASVTVIAGLDPESFAFMQLLASKLVWAREELESLAAEHNLMLDGTLDSINDASFDHFGGPFFEGDDPIEIDAEYAKEIAA